MAVRASSVVTKPGIRLTLLALWAFVASATVSPVALASPEEPSSGVATQDDSEPALSSERAHGIEEMATLSVAEFEAVETEDTELDAELDVPALGQSAVLSRALPRVAEDSAFVSRAIVEKARRSSVSARAPPFTSR